MATAGIVKSSHYRIIRLEKVISTTAMVEEIHEDLPVLQFLQCIHQSTQTHAFILTKYDSEHRIKH